MRFMTSSLSGEEHLAYLPTYMGSLLKAAMLNDAIFQEANDFSSCAIWVLPGRRVDNTFTLLPAGLIGCLFKVGIGGLKRMLWDFEHQLEACKRKGLVDSDGNVVKKYHYLFFIATDEAARGKGLASKLVAQYQEKAAAENVPIWIEATTAHSRDVYARQGFRVVQDMCLGKGTHAASGVMEKGGPGVVLYTMIWWPEPSKDNTKTNRSSTDNASES